MPTPVLSPLGTDYHLNSQKKGSGKAPGLHNPANSGDTFSDIFGRRGDEARPDRGDSAGCGAAQTGPASRGGLKRRNEMSGRANDNRNDGGKSGGRRIGGHRDSVTDVDLWGPFDHFPGAVGGSGGLDASLVRITDNFVLFWQTPSRFSQWTACSFEVDGVSEVLLRN